MLWKPYTINQIPSELIQYLRDNNIPDVFAPILLRRNLVTSKDLEMCFNGTLSDTTPSTAFGQEMVKAVQRIQKAFVDKQRVVVFADYDVDGSTGAALIREVFSKMQTHYGFECEVMIPDRFTEGYGLNNKNIGRLLQYRPNLVITVDCGISSGEQIAELRKHEVDVIVTDHHEPKAELPTEAVAIVHPTYCDYPFKGLSGCGVAYQLMRGLYEVNGKTAPSWLTEGMLDLVACGAVCDIMPLHGDNRVYLREGMKKIWNGDRLAFRLMKERLKWKKVDTRTLGFQIGPRINAAGRMEDADIVVRLLTSQNPNECHEILDELESRNTRRREEQDHVVEEGLIQMQTTPYQHIGAVIGQHFHEGVVGIAASKIMELYYRPIFVLADHGESLKGSARSIDGVHLFQLIQKHEHLLDAFGGHAKACGLTIPKANVKTFFDELELELALYPEEIWTKVHFWEGEVDASTLSDFRFTQTLAKLEPFGEQFPEIRWKVQGEMTKVRWIDEEKGKKTGDMKIGNMIIPFAMFKNADHAYLDQQQTYFGKFEYNDYWRCYQFVGDWVV